MELWAICHDLVINVLLFSTHLVGRLHVVLHPRGTIASAEWQMKGSYIDRVEQ